MSNELDIPPDLLEERKIAAGTMNNGRPISAKSESTASALDSSLKSDQTQQSVLPSLQPQSASGKKSFVPGSVNMEKAAVKTKLDLSCVSTENILAEIEVRMKRLHNKEDYRNSETYDDLEYLKATSRYGKFRSKERLLLMEKLTELGVVDLFKIIYSKYFGTAKVHRVLRDILVVLWNGTDSCLDMCKMIIKGSILSQIIDNLNSDILGPDVTDVGKLYIIKGFLGIINNTSRLVDESAAILRDLSAVDVLKKYLNSKNSMIRCKCELILAYIMTEKQYEEMNADDSNIQFLIKLLEDAMLSPEHKSSKYGFSADEILQGLNKIAVSDSNKLKLVAFGALKHYVTLMEPNCSSVENFEAARGIWNLAFKCADDIRQLPGCLESMLFL